MIKLTDKRKARTKASAKPAPCSTKEQNEALVETIVSAGKVLRAAGAAAPSGDSGPPPHQVIKLGIDVPLDRYVVVRQIDGGAPQPPQRFSPSQFLDCVGVSLLTHPVAQHPVELWADSPDRKLAWSASAYQLRSPRPRWHPTPTRPRGRSQGKGRPAGAAASARGSRRRAVSYRTGSRRGAPLGIRGEGEAGPDVVFREVGIILENLRVGHAASQHIENFIHRDPQASNARLPATLSGFNRNGGLVIHVGTLASARDPRKSLCAPLSNPHPPKLAAGVRREGLKVKGS